MLKVSGMLLVRVGSVQMKGISIFWHRKCFMNTWYSSNICKDFVDISCVIFSVQNVLIPPIVYYLRNLRILFYPCIIVEWNKLYHKIRNSNSYLSFRNALINFMRPSEKKMFNMHDQVGIKLLTRLRLGFSHLRE